MRILSGDDLRDVDLDRYWSKVDIQGLEDCWTWQGAVDSRAKFHARGYGHGEFKVNNRVERAHRVSYALHNAVELTSKDIVRHTCNNPPCCNPAHLLVGTHADNVQDRVLAGNSAFGTKNGRTKLTEEQALFIKHCVLRPSELARHFKVDPKVIYDIRRGKTWKYLAGMPAPVHLSLGALTTTTTTTTAGE